jgi:hypothetical protein
MWVRFGRWVELGIHFGTQHTLVDVLDRYLVHASVRVGKNEWNHGPRRQEVSRHLNTPSGSPPFPYVHLYPDPEPLRWGIRKIVSGVSHSAVDTKHPAF